MYKYNFYIRITFKENLIKYVMVIEIRFYPFGPRTIQGGNILDLK